MNVLLLPVIFYSCLGLDHHARTNQLPNRSTIVHLFEWKWEDIAEECERFLAPKGFGGVQISPPSENLIVHLANGKRTWYERYQVMSYNIQTRSGDQEDFLNMTTRCNKVGVRIYADVVLNHMTGNHKDNKGTGGSTADFADYSYPGVPYRQEHFHHPYCIINDYNNVPQVRNCQLLGLKDLNQSMGYVQQRILNYCNKLIELGVAGIRVDAAKHMWPRDLQQIYSKLRSLNTDFGFLPNTRPYIYQEVIYYGNEPIKLDEYTPLGDVTEFRVGAELDRVFRGRNALKWLVSWGEDWNLSPSDTAFTFIDNHDTQRNVGVLTYKESKAYKAAVAFILAHPYGEPRIMSSYFFDTSEQGPPNDDNENIISPNINKNGTCGSGWVCEHRWRQIYQMVGFRNAARNTSVENWWDNGNCQIAFSRGDRGFIAFNAEMYELNKTLKTGLPEGEYCDVISGQRQGSACTGTKVRVDQNGLAHIYISNNAEDMHLAIHVGKETSLSRGEYWDVIPGQRQGSACTGTKVQVDQNGLAHIYISNNGEDMHIAIHVGKELRTKAFLSVRNCQLLGLEDLNQSIEYVQQRILNYCNKLIELGVAGIRVDAAKHMWPRDLQQIYSKLRSLNTDFGFLPNTRPYIYQEVIYYGNEPIKLDEYTPLGDVTEFRVGAELGRVFRGRNALKWLVSWGEDWNLSPSDTALTFIDNHDTQRNAAVAFILAHSYGEPRIMSSYFFDTSEQGPPNDDNENIISPNINKDGTCGNGWVCEHRWRQIYQMVGFRNAARNTSVENWWDNGNCQVAFSRGDRGFIAFNTEMYELNKTLKTGLPEGEYCDVISGQRQGSACTGTKVQVDQNGFAHIYISNNAEDMHLAIHVGKESRIMK